MERPSNLSLDDLINIQDANDAIRSVGMTTAERQALLLVPQTLFCRDIHALDSAGVVFLFALSMPISQADTVQAGPCVYVHYGSSWIANRLCCEGSGLSKELLDSAIEAGAVFGVHALPFAVETSNPHYKSAVKKLCKLFNRKDVPPCNTALNDWLAYLAQSSGAADAAVGNSSSAPAGAAAPQVGPLFVLCGAKTYWKQRPFFQAASEQGRLIQRSDAVMQQHKTSHQGWRLSNKYYAQQDLDLLSGAIAAGVARLQQSPLPPPALPPTAAYPLRLQLKGNRSNIPAAAAPADATAPGFGTTLAGATAAAPVAPPPDPAPVITNTAGALPAAAPTPAPAPASAAAIAGPNALLPLKRPAAQLQQPAAIIMMPGRQDTGNIDAATTAALMAAAAAGPSGKKTRGSRFAEQDASMTPPPVAATAASGLPGQAAHLTAQPPMSAEPAASGSPAAAEMAVKQQPSGAKKLVPLTPGDPQSTPLQLPLKPVKQHAQQMLSAAAGQQPQQGSAQLPAGGASAAAAGGSCKPFGSRKGSKNR